LVLTAAVLSLALASALSTLAPRGATAAPATRAVSTTTAAPATTVPTTAAPATTTVHTTGVVFTELAARPLVGFDGQATRSVSVNDTGHLRLLKAFGSVLLEEGYAGGTLPGQAKVRLVVGSTVTSSFSIQTKYGTIYGSGRAALHSSGRYASFGGTLSVSRGTGSYARAHGAGKLYGVIDRRTSALTVQTVGTLSY
jgi:hypothetical protein